MALTHSPESRRVLEAAERLSVAEMDAVVADLLDLRARRQGKALPAQQAELLERIHAAVPEEWRRRRDALCLQQQDADLTDAETVELERLVDRIEERQAERVRWIGELAQLLGILPSEVLQRFDLAPRTTDRELL